MISEKDRIKFMRLFTQELVLNSVRPNKADTFNQEGISRVYNTLNIQPTPRQTLSPQMPQKIFQSPQIQTNKPIIYQNNNNLPISKTQAMGSQTPISRQLPNPMHSLSAKTSNIQINKIENNLTRLKQLISNKNIRTIECSGEGKFITVKVANSAKLTNIALTKEEIQAIIKEFSEKTRIPIITGVFKARTEDIVFTAIISDIVPLRFVITRVFPQQFKQKV